VYKTGGHHQTVRIDGSYDKERNPRGSGSVFLVAIDLSVNIGWRRGCSGQEETNFCPRWTPVRRSRRVHEEPGTEGGCAGTGWSGRV